MIECKRDRETIAAYVDGSRFSSQLKSVGPKLKLIDA